MAFWGREGGGVKMFDFFENDEQKNKNKKHRKSCKVRLINGFLENL